MKLPLCRLLPLLCLAAVAQYLAFQFIFPGYYQPLSAHHPDMYLPASDAAGHFGLHDVFGYSRPVLMLLAVTAGRLGFEGSMVVFTLFSLINFALAVLMLETLVLKVTVRWHVVLATGIVTFSFPGFYLAYTHDVGASFATFFGLLGIYALVTTVNTNPAWLLAGSLFCLSSLSKESFLPVAFIAVLAMVARRRKLDAVSFLLLALPLIALAVMLVDSHLTSSIFVKSASAPDDPYHIVLQARSIWKLLWFYIGPTLNPWTAALIGVCAFQVWRTGRLAIFLLLLLSSLALYSPYTLLPNHKMGTYWWSASTLLPLIIPLALTGGASTHAQVRHWGAYLFHRWTGTFSVILIWFLGVMTVVSFSTFAAGNEQWSILQQNINRNLLSGVRAAKPQLATARSVLVCGLTFPFTPWARPEFMNRELEFHGVWHVVQHEARPAPGVAASVQMIRDRDIQWSDYDLVIAFDDTGALTGIYDALAILDLVKQTGLLPPPLTAALRNPRLLHQITAFRLMPTNPNLARAIGAAFLSAGQSETACRYLQTAVESAPSDPVAHFYLGNALAALHRCQRWGKCSQVSWG